MTEIINFIEKSANQFQKGKFFKVFIIYGHGGHLGHVTETIYINFSSPFVWMLLMKFGFDRPQGFGREDV